MSEQEAPYIGHDCDPRRPDSEKVICPACCTKFWAIPVNVQQLMLDAGFKPPFTAAPAPQAQPVVKTPPEWWPPVENILTEYGLAAISFVADFKKASGDYPVVLKQYIPAPQAQPLTDEQILNLVGGMQDCLSDPYDAEKNGDYYSSIPRDMIRLVRAAERHHGIGEKQ